MKLDRTLSCWGGYTIECITDEDIEDIEYAFVTNNHGDDWLIVKTKEGKIYKYGWWFNLSDSEIWIDTKDFITKPVRFKKKDKNSNLANDFYRFFKNLFYEESYPWGFREEHIRKNDSKEEVKYRIDMLAKELDRLYESGIEYSKHQDRNEVIAYLRENNAEVDLKYLYSLHWDSKVDGYDGVAGKEDISDYDICIYSDSLPEMYVGSIDMIDAVECEDSDDWGVRGYDIYFAPNRELRAKKELVNSIFDDEEWDDCYDYECAEVEKGDYVFLLYKTIIDCETDTPYYLCVHKNSRIPDVKYMTLEEIKEVVD